MTERPIACPEWQDDLAGWLMAQLSPEREDALRAHLTGCDGCRAEADSLLGVAAVALSTDPGEPGTWDDDEPPSPDLGDRIVAQIAGERRGRRRAQRAVGLVGIAAVAVAALLITRPDDPAPLRGDPVEFAVRPTGATAHAVVAADHGGSLVELTATGLDPATTYALWLTPPGGGYAERVPAGTFQPDADGTVDVRLKSALSARRAARVWVTDPEGNITLDTESA